MDPIVLPLHDDARGRPLPTTVYVPRAGATALLIVFGHGFWGHPRKFTRLFGRWVNGGYLVAAPAFPHKTGENPPPYLIEDVANQPGDVSFVLDELLARALGDSERVGVGGFDSSHAAVIDPAVSVLESASFTAASGTPSNSSRLARTPQPPIEATSRRVGVGPASSQPRGAADVAPPSLVAGPSPSTCRESCVSSAVTSTDNLIGLCVEGGLTTSTPDAMPASSIPPGAVLRQVKVADTDHTPRTRVAAAVPSGVHTESPGGASPRAGAASAAKTAATATAVRIVTPATLFLTMILSLPSRQIAILSLSG